MSEKSKVQKAQAPKAKKAGSVFQRLFRKQQPKVNANEKVGNVLKTFAEDDYRRIAVLIQKWLEKDQNKKRH